MFFILSISSHLLGLSNHIYSKNAAKHHSLQKTSDFSLPGQASLLGSPIAYISLYICPVNTGSFVCLQLLVCGRCACRGHVCLIHLSVHDIQHGTWHMVSCESEFID